MPKNESDPARVTNYHPVHVHARGPEPGSPYEHVLRIETLVRGADEALWQVPGISQEGAPATTVAGLLALALAELRWLAGRVSD